MFPMLLQLITHEDGYYALTKSGNVVLIALVALLVIIAILAMTRKDKDTDLRTIRITVSAISLALAFVTSFFRLFELPWGGSVTLFSMFFVCFVGYLYGPATGLTAAFSYSILQFFQSGGSYVLSIPQALFDYIFAFTALGIAGFFFKKKNGLLLGFIAGCIARGVFASIAGYLYWMDYMPETFPKSIAFLYPICYNYSYILIEMVMTIIVLLLPPVKKAINMIAFEATRNRRGAKVEAKNDEQ